MGSLARRCIGLYRRASREKPGEEDVFLRSVEEGFFKVSFTPTNCQTADILTKALARVNHEDLTEKLGMINIYNTA